MSIAPILLNKVLLSDEKITIKIRQYDTQTPVPMNLSKQKTFIAIGTSTIGPHKFYIITRYRWCSTAKTSMAKSSMTIANFVLHFVRLNNNNV